MSKIGRNEPCPCGSGRKYKHCCEGKIKDLDKFLDEDKMEEYHTLIDNWDSPEPRPTFMEFIGRANTATSHIKEIQKELEGKKFESIEELNQYYHTMNQQMNSKPKDDFLGISSEQMFRIL